MVNYNRLDKPEFSLKSYFRSIRWSVAALRQCSPSLGILLLFSSVLSSLIPVFSTVVLGILVSRFVKTNNSYDGLIMWLVLAILLFLTGSILKELEKYIRSNLTDELALFMQKKLYGHANRLPLAFFEDNRSLNQLFLARSGSGASSVLAPVNSAINVVVGFFQTASLFGLMAWYAPLPGALLIIAVVPMLLLQWYMAKQRYLLNLSTTERRRWGNYFTSLLTQPKTLIPVRMLGLCEVLLERFVEKIQSINWDRKKLYLKRVKLAISAQLFFFLVFGVILVWMFFQRHLGELTTKGLVIFGIAAFRAKLSTAKIIGSTTSALNSSYIVNYILDFFETSVDDSNQRSDSLQVDGFNTYITFEKLSFAYENTVRDVLKNISFTIRAGQKIAIVGTNGAGKSTLVKLLCRLYNLRSGKIFLNETDLSKLSPHAINKIISIVTQNPIRFEGTVKENIAFGNWEKYKDDDAEIYHILEKAKLADFVKQLPDGLNTLIGRKFGNYTMSGGQWQRLAIARILTRSTPVLILDEPTSNLDAIAEQEMFQMLCDQVQKQTVIFITHRFSTVKMVDRIIVLEDGCLVEDGSHDELIKQNGIYTAMYRAYQGE